MELSKSTLSLSYRLSTYHLLHLVFLFFLGFKDSPYLAFSNIGLIENKEFSLQVSWDLILEEEFEGKEEEAILKTQHISTTYEEKITQNML